MDISNNDSQETSNYTTILDPDESFMVSFKAAAAAVTELYTKGANQRRQAFQNGYQKCLEDLMNFPNAAMMYNHPNQREIDNIDTGQEGGIGTLMGNDSLKRRLNEQNFMGRPMTDLSFFEHPLPPVKRGRLRKEE
ncbi:11102_t:CDS:2 [Ambispora leptoticha]|uniref:11102_t:CDS:1 n=1 Tax=Ambispora leptoticha TaxID=144679 RepID=A0A9N9EBV7_9GLOM|nr:11102_t:CDS:2 [Ambispora leptoticha]